MDYSSLAKQLAPLVEQFRLLNVASRKRDLSDVVDDAGAVELVTRAIAAIQRLSGRSSVYAQQVDLIHERYARSYPHLRMIEIMGVVKSLKADIESGFLVSVEELIHGELFDDFLDMSSHLLDEGYKDAAAVIAGSSLEGHLRQLANKHGIPQTYSTRDGEAPKKADSLNADLAKVSAYVKGDQKSITGWLDLRNSAAHGKYGDYTKEQVKLQIEGIRNFIVRVPA